MPAPALRGPYKQKSEEVNRNQRESLQLVERERLTLDAVDVQVVAVGGLAGRAVTLDAVIVTSLGAVDPAGARKSQRQ